MVYCQCLRQDPLLNIGDGDVLLIHRLHQHKYAPEENFHYTNELSINNLFSKRFLRDFQLQCHRVGHSL